MMLWFKRVLLSLRETEGVSGCGGVVTAELTKRIALGFMWYIGHSSHTYILGYS